jgi:hypothetical protein
MNRRLAIVTALTTLFYVGMFMDPVMFWIQDLQASLLGQ